MLKLLKVKGYFVSVIVLISMLVGCFSVSATVLSNIDLEDAIFEADWDLVDSGVTYREKHIDHNNVVNPKFSTWTPSGTGNSLKFEHLPYTGTLKQRTEIVAKEHEPFNTFRCVGYNLATTTDSNFPSDWMVINQFHQEGYFVSPIGELSFEPSTTEMRLTFSIRNTDYYYIDGNRGIGGSSKKLWSTALPRSSWKKLVIGFKPDPNGAGQVQIWYDGNQVTNWADGTQGTTWTGKLGFPANFKSKPFVTTYYNSFGIYRAPQNLSMKMYFDNFKWGTTYTDVAPQ